MCTAQMADHPLLLRSFYSDKKLNEIARLLKKHYRVRSSEILGFSLSSFADLRLSSFVQNEFDGEVAEVVEDLQLNSDFVIHQTLVSHPKIPATYHLDLSILHRPWRSGVRGLSTDPLVLSSGNLWEASAKMDRLRSLLPELFKRDRRVLIFSLMTRCVDRHSPEETTTLTRRPGCWTSWRCSWKRSTILTFAWTGLLPSPSDKSLLISSTQITLSPFSSFPPKPEVGLPLSCHFGFSSSFETHVHIIP